MNCADEKNGVPVGPRVISILSVLGLYCCIKTYIPYSENYDYEYLQAHSYWLYNVPWGMYKALMYVKKYYGNPTVILSENGNHHSYHTSFYPAIVSIKIKEIVIQCLS